MDLKNLFVAASLNYKFTDRQRDLLYNRKVRSAEKLYDELDVLYMIVIDAFYNLSIRDVPKENHPVNRIDAVDFASEKITALKLGKILAAEAETPEKLEDVMSNIVNSIADSLGY